MRMKPDWGIPDWLDPGSYGDTKQWSEFRWRWEFTRRRDDCREDFLAYKDEAERFHQQVPADEILRWLGVERGDRRLRPDEPGFTAPVPHCYEKYGIGRLPNPAIGDQPFYVLIFRKRRPVMVMFPEDGVDVEETDAVIKFDVTAPLDYQLEGARQLLEGKQKSKLGHLVRPSKKHPGKWLRYLRVLDARESGATFSVIEQSGILKGLREEPQAARDVFQQARALCFKWPV